MLRSRLRSSKRSSSVLLRSSFNFAVRTFYLYSNFNMRLLQKNQEYSIFMKLLQKVSSLNTFKLFPLEMAYALIQQNNYFCFSSPFVMPQHEGQNYSTIL